MCCTLLFLCAKLDIFRYSNKRIEQFFRTFVEEMNDLLPYLKYIGAFLGLIWGHNIWLGLLGYMLGSALSGLLRIRNTIHVFTNVTTSSPRADRSGFLRALMVLSAHIIHADGKIMHSEMETMRRFLLQNFGEEVMNEGNEMILKLFQQKKSMSPEQWNQYIAQTAMSVSMVMSPQQCVQLLSYLMDVAKADSKLSQEEIAALRQVATYLRLDPSIIDQLMGLGGSSVEDAYQVLGVSPDASDDEVRRAYRKMALDNHPDRVASLGEDVRRAAEKKFKEITDAKDRIYKARGIK